MEQAINLSRKRWWLRHRAPYVRVFLPRYYEREISTDIPCYGCYRGGSLVKVVKRGAVKEQSETKTGWCVIEIDRASCGKCACSGGRNWYAPVRFMHPKSVNVSFSTQSQWWKSWM